MFVAKHARPSLMRSGTVVNEMSCLAAPVPGRPVEKGATMDASASDKARPAWAARRPPQSLPPSPAMPTTKPRPCRYLTTLILSSGFIRAKTTHRDQSSSILCLSTLYKCRQAEHVSASWQWGSGLSGDTGRPSLSGSVQTSWPFSTVPRRQMVLVTIPQSLPMAMPVSSLSPVQITERTEPSLRLWMASGESAFISFRKRSRPQTLTSCSSCSLGMLRTWSSVMFGPRSL
mmetsp:Transcript_6976/g.16610  ORF Transcript_6976/g.16610 Transcript_6976/m.16610 type:complete len:231 (-) Transcript_6976:2306-2998(-)